MVDRKDVYEAIDSEREYQDRCIITDPKRHAANGERHTVGSYITMLATYLRRAEDAWTDHAGDEQALHVIRKIAGIAVHCMEEYGAPKR